MSSEREGALARLADEVRGCTECPLHCSRRVAVPGEGPLGARWLLVGEAPGAKEDHVGRPFVGASGRFLRAVMEAVGIDPATVYITNIVKCRPPKNRTPHAGEVATCTGLYLVRQVELVKPEALVALGATAASALLAGPLKITKDHGQWRRDYDLTPAELQVFVTFHPAAALRSERWRAALREDLQQLVAGPA